MNKKIIVSDSEKNSILEMHKKYKTNKVLSEQEGGTENKKAIQCFLNKKGVTDNQGDTLDVDGSIGNYPNSKSAQAIFKYQEMIGAQTDGVWGEETINKMPPLDKKMYDECEKEYQGLIDKFLGLF